MINLQEQRIRVYLVPSLPLPSLGSVASHDFSARLEIILLGEVCTDYRTVRPSLKCKNASQEVNSSIEIYIVRNLFY